MVACSILIQCRLNSPGVGCQVTLSAINDASVYKFSQKQHLSDGCAPMYGREERYEHKESDGMESSI